VTLDAEWWGCCWAAATGLCPVTAAGPAVTAGKRGTKELAICGGKKKPVDGCWPTARPAAKAAASC